LKYSGIKMNCAAGVHEEAERLVLVHLDPVRDRAGLSVLDIAAGYGAMTKRLLDAGFADVSAWDLDTSQMSVPGVSAQAVDLNGDFGSAHPDAFDVVVAIEVLEHLENPRHFFRNLAMVLRDGGVAIVTTPNVESAMSRVDFLARGGLRWFTKSNRAKWGHMTPVFSWQLREAARAAGLELLEQGHNSQGALLTIESGTAATLKGLLGAAAYPWMAGAKNGDIHVWAFRRGAA
jgi:SAM-dependent methyltransferase